MQSVERAELAAAASVILAASRPLGLKTDCQYIVDGLHQCLQGIEPCFPELDVWRQVFVKIQSMPDGFLRVSKVPGHPSRKDIFDCKASLEDYN